MVELQKNKKILIFDITPIHNMNTRIAALFFLITFHTSAQDSLVYFSDLKFQSGFELESFKKYNQPGLEPVFNLMMADGKLLNETEVERHRVSFFKTLDELKSKLADKSESKKAKSFATTIKEKYMLQYSEETDFESVFAAGRYNELTATMLYALGLEYLNIPYQIVLEPGNFLVVAYPSTNPLRIDSAPSSVAVTTISNEYMNQYVAMLRNQKIISEKEYKSKSLKELFDEYYFGKVGQIKLENLISIYYLHIADNFLKDDKHLLAFEASEKALYINANARATYYATNLVADAFLSIKEKNLKQAELLGKYTRYKPQGYSDDVALGEFVQAGEKLLVSEGKKEAFRIYYEKVLAYTFQPVLNQKITTYYYTLLGNYFSKQGSYDSSFVQFDKAISINKEDQNLHLDFIRCLYLLGEQGYGSKSFQDKVMTSRLKHPQLAKFRQFQQLAGSVLLAQVTYAFQSNKPQVGEKLLTQFEQDKELHVTQPSMISSVYSLVAVFYFQKNQTQKAKEILNRGLLIVPDNFELKQRKKMIN
ncbi:MAG: hypothetical protein ACK48F_08625 [Chryseotalea sp.]